MFIMDNEMEIFRLYKLIMERFARPSSGTPDWYVERPAQSPDLYVHDFWLWGY